MSQPNYSQFHTQSRESGESFSSNAQFLPHSSQIELEHIHLDDEYDVVKEVCARTIAKKGVMDSH